MSVGFDRFLRKVSGGKYSSNSLFTVRGNKVRDTLAALNLVITDLENWNVAQAPDLREEYNRANNLYVQVSNNVNPHGTASQFRAACDQLEPVKKEIRITRIRAESLHGKVDGVRNEPLAIAPQNSNVVEFNKEIAKARQELRFSPATVDKIFDHIGTLSARRERIDNQAIDLAQNAGGFGNLQGNELAAHNNATGMSALLQSRINDLTILASKHPFTEQQIYQAKAVEVTAGIKLLDDVIQRFNNANINVPAPVTAARQALITRRTALLQRNQSIQVKDPKTVLGPKEVSGKAKKKLLATLNGNNGLAGVPLDSDKVNEGEVVKTVLERAFHNLNNNQKQVGKVTKLDDRLDELHVRALNDGPWTQITKPVRYTKVDGTHMALTSDIKPATTLGDVFTDMNGQGVCSHDAKQHRHAVNLASTEVRDGNTVLFSGLRHGINSAFGMTPSKLKEMPDDELEPMVRELLTQQQMATAANPNGPNYLDRQVTATIARLKGNSSADKKFAAKAVKRMRKQANLNRSQEIVLAALLKNGTELAKAQAGQQATLTINSVSLVTPSFRPGSDTNKEDKMLKDQMKAWQDLDGQVITVPIRNPGFLPNQPITPQNPQNLNAQVLVKVIAFNFGVNVGAVGKSGLSKEGVVSALGTAGGAWRDSDKYNTPAMNRLIGTANERAQSPTKLAGEVGDWLTQNPIHPNFGVVEQLGRQVADIWDTEEYKRSGTEPYKMVSRLAVLAFKMGSEPAFNCKSGKDRTGQLDVETKLLATQVSANGGTVPQPNRDLDTKDKANRLEMALNSGSLEMQQLNTGHMGFKLNDVSSLDRSYGSDINEEGLEAFKGTSSYTKA